jgi:hypothetical protein
MGVRPPTSSVKSDRREQRPDVLWTALVIIRIVVGICLAVMGGVAFGRAYTDGGGGMWIFGASSLLAGLGLTLSGILARYEPPPKLPVMEEVEEAIPAPDPVVPLLGALLVYKYKFIDHRQLQQALATQAQSVPRRRLGEVLVSERFITHQQLEEVVAFQQAAFVESSGRDSIVMKSNSTR